jgi:hypothetical protein
VIGAASADLFEFQAYFAEMLWQAATNGLLTIENLLQFARAFDTQLRLAKQASHYEDIQIQLSKTTAEAKAIQAT